MWAVVVVTRLQHCVRRCRYPHPSGYQPYEGSKLSLPDTPLGPFKPEPVKPSPLGQRDPLSQFATNPHVTFVAKDNTYLLFFNGRKWAPNDLTGCQPNKTGASPWHGGGRCAKDADCPGFGAGTSHAQAPGKCVDSQCVCEHHSFGLHCDQIVETVNLAYAPHPSGPWTQLLPDGSPFWSGLGGGNDSLALSNPSGFALENGTIVLAYSRAPGTGISIAHDWRGPYHRLSLPSNSLAGGRNYSLAGCGEE